MATDPVRALVDQLRGELSHDKGWDYTEYEKGRIAEKERAISLLEAALAQSAQQSDEDAHVIDRLAHLLAEISVIVNGPEPAGTKWSYHDIPAKVAALKGGAK